MLVRLGCALVAAVVTLLAAGAVLASAEEGEGAASEQASSPVLLPGANLVGWVGESRSVVYMRRQVSAIEKVAAWDALHQREYEPAVVEPGMGVRIVVSGEEPIEWQPPETPVKSRLLLRRGRNLVAWLGPDDWAIDRVVLGIGRALVRAQWSDATYAPASSVSIEPLPTVRRGEALWIEVSRDVQWLQPAGIMPTIKFAGAVSAEVQAEVRRDSVDVMNHFADRFSLQPDGSILTVYVAADVESLVKVFEADGLETRGLHETWYKSGGWANSAGYIVLKTEQWEPDYGSRRLCEYGECAKGRAVMAHEYFHSIQQQLSDTEAPTWLVEGGADWAEAGLILQDADSTYDSELVSNRATYSWAEGPPLDHTERRHDEPWAYTLGALASQRLALRSGEQSLVEFWRALLPVQLGPLGRWSSDPPWQIVFYNVFDITVDDFYDEFAEWRGSLAANSVKGRVIGPDGQGLPYVKVVGRSQRLSDEHRYDYTETLTDGQGNFDLAVNELGVIQVGVDLGGCEVYYTSSGAVYNWEHAETLMPSSGGVERVSMALTNETCVWRINGVLVGPNGKPLTDVRVLAESESARVGDSTDTGGVFEIAVPLPDLYRLSIWLDEHDCRVYYRRGDPAGSWNQATQVNIEDRDVSGLKFQLVDGLCSLKITGQLLDANGVPIPDVSVWANSDDGGHGSAGTDSDGGFSVAISEPGRFRVAARIDGCTVFHRRGGVTSMWDRATLVRVSSKDVSDVTLQLADGMCERRISGRLLNPDGSPHANQWVRASGRQGSGGAHSGADGSFAFAVPASGTYLLETDFAECRIRHSNRGPTEHWNSARQIRVSNADVTGIEFRLPEDPASFCD